MEGKDHYQLEVKAFAAAVLKGEESPLAVEDACNNMKIIDAMFESDASGRAVEFGQGSQA